MPQSHTVSISHFKFPQYAVFALKSSDAELTIFGNLLPERVVRALSTYLSLQNELFVLCQPMGSLLHEHCLSFVSDSEHNLSFLLLRGRFVVQLRSPQFQHQLRLISSCNILASCGLFVEPSSEFCSSCCCSRPPEPTKCCAGIKSVCVGISAKRKDRHSTDCVRNQISRRDV